MHNEYRIPKRKRSEPPRSGVQKHDDDRRAVYVVDARGVVRYGGPGATLTGYERSLVHREAGRSTVVFVDEATPVTRGAHAWYAHASAQRGWCRRSTSQSGR
jgi:hypothetical protein